MASTSGQTTGPPAEKAYAVEPVGVAQMTASAPHRESGRLSICTNSSNIVVSLRSITNSLSAQPESIVFPSLNTLYSMVSLGSPTKLLL